MHLYFIFFVPGKGEMNPKTFGYIKNVFDNLFSNINIIINKKIKAFGKDVAR